MRIRVDGFTLIEVAFAVLILASSLIVLLGLQSASIQRSLRDRNAQQAMLIARSLLSAVEIQEDPDQLTDFEGNADETFQFILGHGNKLGEPLDPDERFAVSIRVTKVPLPFLDDELLRQLTISVRWSDQPLDALVVDYFVALSPT